MRPDCQASQAVLQRSLSDLNVSDLDLQRALHHLAGCERCGRLLSPVTVACAKVEPDLIAYSQALREGRRARRRWPALARHLDSCERCAEIVTELVEPAATASTGASEAGSDIDPGALFERALVAGLSDPDPVVRERAAVQLGRRRP
jgi:hypothetical protein